MARPASLIAVHRSLVIPIYQTYQPDADDIALPGEGNSAVDALERFLHSSEHRFKAFRYDADGT